MSKEITCFFTGHRDVPHTRYDDIYNKTLDTIRRLYTRGYRIFVCGGAVGYDTLAARAVMELRDEFSDTQLVLCLPCRDQDKYFSEPQKREYERILNECDGYEVLYDRYVRGCMHARNRKMADMSSACVAFCEKETGGSAYTVHYAISRCVDVYFVK